MLYLEQLALRAGHKLDVNRIDRDAWMDASRRAHNGDYAPMAKCIEGAIVGAAKSVARSSLKSPKGIAANRSRGDDGSRAK